MVEPVAHNDVVAGSSPAGLKHKLFLIISLNKKYLFVYYKREDKNL